MRIFVISLKEAFDRRNRMQQMLLAAGIPFEFFDAIKGVNLTDDELIKHQIVSAKALTKPELGVMLSHILIWQKIVEGDIQKAVILEDDVHFGTSFKKVINDIHIPAECCGLYRLETVLASVDMAAKPTQEIGGIKIHQIFSNHSASAGYLLNAKTAKHLLTQVPKMRLAFDNELFDPVRRNIQGVDVFQCVPGVVIQDAALMKAVDALDKQTDYLKSTIGDARVDHQFGFVEPKKLTLIEKFKNAMRPIYLFLYNLALLPKRRKRVRIEFEGNVIA